MTSVSPTGAWVFISHSSEDLTFVRKVRNYLEEKGAAPLLFHLLSLKNPEEFWPVIEREILERNFFLYCESKAAEQSEWVRRERQAVARGRGLGAGKSIRIGHVRVETQLDTAALDEFIEKTRVFPSFARSDRDRVEPYLDALKAAGFQVFYPLTGRKMSPEWTRSIDTEIAKAARTGWIVIFLSREANTSPWVIRETEKALELRGKIVPVDLDRPDSGPEALVRALNEG